MKNKKSTNIFVRVVMLFFVLQLAVPAILFYPQKAQAQADAASTAATVTQTSLDAADRVKQEAEKVATKVESKVWTRIQEGLILSASITLRNTLVSLARDAATQSYEWMTTGSWGEGPMFYDSAWGKFTDDIMTHTVGRFLENLQGMAWDELGFDICDPGSQQIKLNIALGLDRWANRDLKRKAPDCSWKALSENWSAFYEQIETMAARFKDQPFAASMMTLQQTLDVSFDKKSSDIGVYLTLEDQLTRQQRKAVDEGTKTRTENLGSKAITDLIGDTIKTPAFLTRGHMTNEAMEMQKSQKDEVAAAGNVISDIPAAVAGAFLSTFVSKGFKDLMNKKFFEEGLVKTSKSYQPKDNLYDQKKQVAQDIQKIKTVSFSYSTKQIDLLTEFTSCPKVRQINNCVMDDNFSAVVRKATQDKPLTVSEAIAEGSIRGDLPLISQNDGRNSSDDCYQQGYCYSNLVKMRKARIIPIGWELAANKVGPEEKVSLKYVVEQFNEKTSKFYHLIDPNWVLKYPATQCKASVYGPLLVDAGTGSRAETCVDMPSCVQTDDNGKCLSWGYCAAEKNIFRLGGEQCNGVYDSCRTLETRQGKTVNYVTNTLDRTSCDQTSVGCKWYATTKTRQGGVMDWSVSGALASAKILLNKNIEDKECSPNDEGCTRLVRTKAGIGVNLVPNGNFELAFEGTPDDGQDDVVPGWANGGQILASGVREGKFSLRRNGELNLPVISIVPKNFTRYFAVSAEVKKVDVAATSSIVLAGENVTQIVPVMNAEKKVIVATTKDVWEKIYNIYEVKPQAGVAVSAPVESLAFKILVAGGPVVLDSVMVEELEMPALTEMSEFNPYANTNSTLNTFLKKAPDYLNCYDTTVAALNGKPKLATDINYANDVVKSAKNKGCADFAQLCTASDVGCQSYKPTDRGRVATGVVSFADYCPQECAGYQTYSQSGTYFEDPAFPLYLIPTTAQTCNASNVGCDEFTNLDDLASGGESKEYYSELRQCHKLPEGVGSCANYYTWVGDKTKGYQLQAYNLKASTDALNVGPASTMGFAEMGVVCNAEIFAAKSNPDCLEFYASNGGVSYRLLSKVVTCSENCHPYRRTVKYTGATAATECTSRQGRFEAGTGECIFMAIPGEGKKCSASAGGCREYKGNFAGDEQVIYENNFSSGDLSKFNTTSALPMTMADGQYVGVLAGNGLGGNFDLPALYTKKDDVPLSMQGEYTVSFWIKNGVNGSATFDVVIKDAANLRGAAIKMLASQIAITKDAWRFYSFNFVADEAFSPGNYVVGVVGSSLAYNLDNFKIVRNDDKKYLIKDSWSTPLSCDNPLVYTPNEATPKSMPQAQLGCREYQDTEKNTLFLKSFSSLCTADKVGCEALIDTKNNMTAQAKIYGPAVSLTEACSAFFESRTKFFIDNNMDVEPDPARPAEVDLGTKRCLLHVRNNDTLAVAGDYVGTFENGCSAAGGTWEEVTATCKLTPTTVGADSLIYLVNSKDKQCKNTESGCTALGLPNLSVDGNGNYVVSADKGWNNVFYKLNPETYESGTSPLCSGAELGCEEYKDDKGAPFYFKDPGKKVCEYRKLSGGTSYGWYIKKEKATDADAPCPSVSEYYGDGVSQVVRATDPLYDGWVGTCKSNANKCTALVDPTDKSVSTVGKAYYYINDENIDKGSCSGVNRKDGCILFNDTSMVNAKGEADLKYNANQTYSNSVKENKLVPAVTTDYTTDVDCTGFSYCAEFEACVKNNEAGAISRVNYNNGVFQNVEATGCFSDIISASVNVVCGANGATRYKNVSCTAKEILKKDTNVTVKVTRDRECASWYACKSSHFAWDSAKNKYVEICDNFGLCDKLSADDDVLNCAHFIQPSDQAENLLARNKKLAEGYSARNANWFDLDYSGMAVPDLAPIQFYSAFDIKQMETQVTEYHCGGSYANKRCNPAQPDCGKDIAGNTISCVALPKNKQFKLVNQLDALCKVDSDCLVSCGNKFRDEGNTTQAKIPSIGVQNEQVNCRCLGNVCVVPANATSFVAKESPDPICRAYPSANSPYPATVQGLPSFLSVNTLWFDEEASVSVRKNDYGCFYTEVKYGGGSIVKYFPNTADYQVDIPAGFCQDREEVPCDCDPDISLAEGGVMTKTMCSSWTCSDAGEKKVDNDGKTKNMPGTCMRKVAQATDYSGWQGYCLENDQSLTKNGEQLDHPCLTWYPSEAMVGLQDLQNQYKTAGFFPDNYPEGPYYCTETKSWVKRTMYVQPNSGAWDCDQGEDNAGFQVTLEEATNLYNSYGVNKITQTPATAISIARGSDSNLTCGVNDAKNANTAFDCMFAKCSPNDCGQSLKKPRCPSNYYVGPVLNIDRDASDSGSCTFDREDWITHFDYLCIPKALAPATTPEKKVSGWFLDTTNGVGNAEKDIKANDCREVYSVGSSVGGQAYRSAAYTNRIYKANNSSISWGSCLFDSLGYAGVINPENVYNMFLSNEDCGPSGSDQNVYYGGKTKTLAQIQQFFAKAFGRWTHNAFPSDGGGTCTSNNPDNIKIGNFCINKNDCASPERIKQYSLGRCADSSPSNKGEYCFTDKDCGGATARDNFPACEAGNQQCLKYCTIELQSVTKPLCDQNGGIFTAAVDGKKASCSAYIYMDGTVGDSGNFRNSLNDAYDCNLVGVTEPSSYAKTAQRQGTDYSAFATEGLFDKTSQKVGLPTIAAVVPSGKKDSRGNLLYSAQVNSLTVNGQTRGDIVGQSGQAVVTVKFYGWANDDQMPIRRVSMNWGDELVIGADGKFQNHKTRCQRSVREKLGLCDNLGGYACKDENDCLGLGASAKCNYSVNFEDISNDRFGDTSGACIESYFQFNHAYSYKASLGDCGGNATNVACNTTYKGKPASRYRLGAQLMDNWGWCNTSNGGGLYAGDFNLCSQSPDAYQFYQDYIYIVK
jgi:hypothetical protein